ncbi:hypothetical protein PIB30_075005 [Stylosanthes scabra]|uniref:Uncharacterized protein n=1 Tax=Stylosanthes scabra TaxID=79078 RepID=A0ABU6WPP2_9FABA|nr:hypothetical protein [Stylosanthes scabra]
MARNAPSPSAKGKCKATTSPQFEIRTALAANVPTSSLLPKKRPIPKRVGEGTSKAATSSFCRRSQRIVAIGHTFFQEAEKEEVIALSSDSEPEKVEEDPEGAPADAPQEAAIEENPKEAAGGNTQDEDNLADFWASIDLSSGSNDWNDYWNYDGDLDNWRNAEPAASSGRSCTGPPPPTSN